MGGTFDPIHLGHLVIAEAARSQFTLNEILFIPNGNPPHKDDSRITNDYERLKMVDLAIADNPDFHSSAMEIEKESYSYTLDTILKLKKIHPNVDFYFIMGEDSLNTIETWYEYEQLLRSVKILVAQRFSIVSQGFLEKIEALNEKGSKIFLLKAPIIEISSTEIRKNLETGQSIRYLVPKVVEDYIRAKGIYHAEVL